MKIGKFTLGSVVATFIGTVYRSDLFILDIRRPYRIFIFFNLRILLFLDSF